MNPRVWFLFQLVKHPTQRRHIIRWVKSLQPDYLLRFGQPWLVFDAIEFLQSLDLKGKQVFEYGSGGSTLFWLHKGATCVSVEHDPRWYTTVQQRLPPGSPIDYRLTLPIVRSDADLCNDPADPECYASNDAASHGYTFREYVSQIDLFPDEHFDVVLIDGRARPSCVKHSMPKIRTGGILVLDNSDRSLLSR